MFAKQVFLPAFALFLLLPLRLSSQGLSASPKLLVKSGTPVKLQLMATMSSGHARAGDRLEFVVSQDFEIGGFTVIRAGANATGSVVKVKRKRPLGIAGTVIIKLDSVQLANGEGAELTASKEFRGRARGFGMAMGLAVTAAIYLPAAPAFLLMPGRDSTVLKGTEVIAYTKGDFSVDSEHLPVAQETDSQLGETINLLPPRVLNREGREGDMLNLIFAAKEGDLEEAFAHAGWVKTETSTPHIIWHLLWKRTHYARLPMEKLYVFGRAQNYSYALPDPVSLVAHRHHLRIWKTDRVVDDIPIWVAAATHDVAIEFEKFRLSHRIDPNVDAERDFIATDLAKTSQLKSERFVHGIQPVFNAQTATGQSYYSDSRILFLELNQRPPVIAAGTGLR
jgi:hypothetical protein